MTMVMAERDQVCKGQTMTTGPSNMISLEDVKSRGGNYRKDVFRRQFNKTSLCRFHATGKCRNGKACPFAHGQNELNVAPDLAKTSICKAWKAGECCNSPDQCEFAHGAHLLRMTPLFKVSTQVKDRGKDKEGRKSKSPVSTSSKDLQYLKPLSQRAVEENTLVRPAFVPASRSDGARGLSISSIQTTATGPKSNESSDQGEPPKMPFPDSDYDGDGNPAMSWPTSPMSAQHVQAPVYQMLVMVPARMMTLEQVVQYQQAYLTKMLQEAQPERYED